MANKCTYLPHRIAVGVKSGYVLDVLYLINADFLIIFIKVILVVLRNPAIPITLGWTFLKVTRIHTSSSRPAPMSMLVAYKFVNRTREMETQRETCLWMVWESTHFKKLKSWKVNNEDILEFVAERTRETS